jgi:hypothetical protein
MNTEAVERVADAILFEGYLLYPYRKSALKNQRRWDFGLLYPPGREADNEPSCFQTEFLADSPADAMVEVQIRFLHTFVCGASSASRQEAVSRSISTPAVPLRRLVAYPFHLAFEFPADIALGQQAIEGSVELSARRLEHRLYRCSLHIRNCTSSLSDTPAERRMKALASVHAILGITDGEFVSLLDPPESYSGAAAECRNVGLWPVLAGEKPSRMMMLASPIILYDYPAIAPESAGDLFDGTEIDELLTLRVLTLTDGEKQEIREGDVRGRAILERLEGLSQEELRRLHGSIRELRPATQDDIPIEWASLEGRDRVESVQIFGVSLRCGDRVRLWPQKRADVLDIALQGRTATIQALEQDYEGQIHIAVVLDDDPGRDLGAMRQAGHRFFFGPEEIEPVRFEEEISGA